LKKIARISKTRFMCRRISSPQKKLTETRNVKTKKCKNFHVTLPLKKHTHTHQKKGKYQKTERQKDRKTERQKDRKIERQKDRKTQKQKN
jgi:hypothetical protein